MKAVRNERPERLRDQCARSGQVKAVRNERPERLRDQQVRKWTDEEPHMALTEQTRAEALGLASRYPQPRSSLLPILHLVQSAEGTVTPGRDRPGRRGPST